MEKDARALYYWGPLVQCKPVIGSSSKYLLAALESTIKVFNTSSGNLVMTLKGHKNEIVGIVSLSDQEDQFISCDEKGTICHWNLMKNAKDKTLKQEFSLDIGNTSEVQTTVVTFTSRGSLNEIILGVCNSKKDTGSLLCYSTPFKTKKPFVLDKQAKLGLGKVAVSQFGDFMVYLTEEKLNVLSMNFTTRKSHAVGTREVTCVTCHPSMVVAATGDCTGRICLWYNLFDVPVKHELHWHSLPVADLAYSSTGAELYSGGGECVLVKWQIIENTRHFLPRLGMPIKYIMTDVKSSKIVCAHVDSAFTVMSAKDFRLEGSIQGVSLSIDNIDPYPAGFTYDPRTKAIILNGKSGHIQFYDLQHNKLLYQLDIVRENYINPERYQKIYNTEVEKVAMSPEGSWLATVEFRDDFESSREVRLKFWNFDSEKQSWFLNTGVEMPHDKYVNGLTFDPSSDSENTSMCVSCSDDGKFKVWEVVDNSDIYRQSLVWKCRSVGFYRHLPATAVTVAPDGSLIATGFANILTIWTAKECHLKGTLSQPYLKEKLMQIEFGRTENCGSMVVSRTKNWLCGWNLFTCTLSWRVMIYSTCLAVDPLSSYMAVFAHNCDAFIFEPQNNLVCTKLEHITSKPVACATFVPRQQKYTSSTPWNEESQLFIIDKAQRLKLIEPKGDIYAAEATIEGVVQQLVQDTAALPAPTPFASLVAQTRVSDVVPEKSSQLGSASFGVNVQNSSAVLQQVMDEARVYRLDTFTSLAKEFCNLVLPEAVTSEEVKEEEAIKTLVKKQENEGENVRKVEKKKKKRNLERGLKSDFSDLLNILT